jgi:parallel beta-helix repeat protein
MFLIIVFVSVACYCFSTREVNASEPITIHADGSIEPETAPISTTDNITYTLTSNFNDSIIILRSNITIDGSGYTLQGPESVPSYAGIHIEFVANNVTIRNLTILDFRVGIVFISTDQNKVFGCSIMNNTYGIRGLEAMNSIISENNITENDAGISFNSGFYNEIYTNNITNNGNGVCLQYSTYNTFYGNYFIGNTLHANVSQGEINFWNETYPIGGNYWSDFETLYPSVTDIFSGEYPQSESGSDGFWDDKYEINIDNNDYYPLVPEFPSLMILPLLLIATLLIIVTSHKQTNTCIDVKK